MSSIMRARNALTGRGEEAEVIGGVLFELKVAGPSMLGIGCPDRHPLPLIHSPPPPKMHPTRRALPRERVRSLTRFGHRHCAHQGGSISPLMIFTNCDASANSVAAIAKVTLTRLSLLRSSSIDNFCGVKPTRRNRK